MNATLSWTLSVGALGGTSIPCGPLLCLAFNNVSILVVLAMDGRLPIGGPVGRTIVFEVGAAEVVVAVLLEDAVVVITLDVDFATNNCEFVDTVVVFVIPPTLIPMEPTAETEDAADIVDDGIDTAGFKCVGKTGPVGFVGGDSDLAPNSTHSIKCGGKSLK